MAFSLLCFSLLLWKCPAFVDSLNEEGQALLSFKGSLKKFPGSRFTSWNSAGETPCSWLGVTGKEHKVVSLSIPNRKLSGTLTSDLGKLSALCHLNLRNSNLFGSLPSDLLNAMELKSLILTGNSLSGPLPPQIGKLNYLLHLELSHNSFNGSIPFSIVQCKRLKNALPRQKLLQQIYQFNPRALKATLDMFHNSFMGPIPENLGKLPMSLYIDLSYNNLSGLIPQVGNLVSAGPTAFIGNPFLCGPPLKLTCYSDTKDMNSQFLIDHPSVNPGQTSAKGAKHFHLGFVIIIGTSVILGICFFAWLFSYSYKKVYASKGVKMIGGCSFEETSIVRKDIFCFAKDALETLSENMDQYNFVKLDQQIDFTTNL